jgi:hypothetical protein
VLNSTEDADLKVVSCSEGSLYETLGAVKLTKGPQADKKGVVPGSKPFRGHDGDTNEHRVDYHRPSNSGVSDRR